MGKLNFANQPVWTGDNLAIMPGIHAGLGDLSCLDAPFNSKADHAAPIGSKAAGAASRDTWSPGAVDALQHLEADHIIARAKGGTDHVGNLQILGGHRNRVKGDRGMECPCAQLQLPRLA